MKIYIPTIQENYQKFSEIDKLRNMYSNVRYGCKSYGYVYNHNTGSVFNINCFHFTCKRCRKILKRKIFLDLLRICKDFDIRNHYVLTTDGLDYRNFNTIRSSYYDMSLNWNKLSLIIKYWYIKKFGHDDVFSYVVMPRSQVNGYCHYHLLTNFVFRQDWLETVVKKYPQMGYVKVGKNKDPQKYLTTDFWKDHEYYIPYGFKHFRTSRNIHFNYRKPKYKDNVVHLFNKDIERIRDLDLFNDKILNKYGCTLPYDVWVKYFYSDVVVSNSNDSVRCVS